MVVTTGVIGSGARDAPTLNDLECAQKRATLPSLPFSHPRQGSGRLESAHARERLPRGRAAWSIRVRTDRAAAARRRAVSIVMNVVKAIALKIISALLFAVMSALVRYLGERYPVGQIVFFRSAF